MEEGLPQDDEVIRKLVEALEHIPLALTQALVYISTREITIGEYLEEYHGSNTTQLKLLSFDFTDHGRQEESLVSVAKAWSISFRAVQNPHAAKLLYLVSFFQNQSIPVLLVQDVDYDYRDNQGSLKAETITEDDAREALVILRAYSLVNIHGNPPRQTLSTHRLVQIATRWWLKTDGLDEENNWAFAALRSIKRRFPKGLEVCNADWWTLSQSLLPHVDLILNYKCTSSSAGLQREIDIEQSRLLYHVGYYHVVNGGYNEGTACFQQCLTLEKEHFGEGHVETMSTMDLLVWLLGVRKLNVRDGVELGENLLRVRMDILGQDHPNTMRSQSHLATALATTCERDRSVVMQTDVVERSERVLGRHHTDTLQYKASLAYILRETGNLAGAILLWREVCQETEKQVRNKDLLVLECQSNLASSLMEGPDTREEGLDLLHHVLQTGVDVLGLDHPEMPLAADHLVYYLDLDGRTARALELANETLKWCEDGTRGNNKFSQQQLCVMKDRKMRLEVAWRKRILLRVPLSSKRGSRIDGLMILTQDMSAQNTADRKIVGMVASESVTWNWGDCRVSNQK